MNSLLLIFGEGNQVHGQVEVTFPHALPALVNKTDWHQALHQPVNLDDHIRPLGEAVEIMAHQVADRLESRDGHLRQTIRIQLQQHGKQGTEIFDWHLPLTTETAHAAVN